MDQNRANEPIRGPGGGAGGNTRSFDRPSQQRAGGSGGAGGESRTEREIERTRDLVAEAAAPVMAEKTQEAISETAHRLTEGPMGDRMKEQMKRTTNAMRADAADMLRARAGEAMGRMEGRANDFMDRAASRLENAARRMDEMADRQTAGAAGRGGMQANAGKFAHGAADRMEEVAGYLRENDVRAVQRDLERQVRERPLQTLLIGVAAGWVAGKILR